MKIPVSKRPIVAVIITIIAICSSLPLQADAAGPKVAVLDFTDYSGAGLNMWDSPKAAAELLQVFLTKAGFGTVERDKLTLILQEQRLSITQLVDSASHAIQVGRLAGADFIVTGAILSLGVEVDQRRAQTATMSVSIKTLDVSTAEVVFADILDSRMPVALFAAEPVFLNSGQTRSLLRSALETAIDSMAPRMKGMEPSGATPTAATLSWRGQPLRILADEDADQLIFEYGGQQSRITFPFDSQTEEPVAYSQTIDYGALLDRELGSYAFNGVQYSALDELRQNMFDVLPPTTEQLATSLAEAIVLYAPGLSMHVPYIGEDGSYYGQLNSLTGKPKTVYVSGYFRRDGTYVRSHYRSK